MTLSLNCSYMRYMYVGVEVLLLIIFLSPRVRNLFTYKPMRQYVEGARILEYKPVRFYAREYGMYYMY